MYVYVYAQYVHIYKHMQLRKLTRDISTVQYQAQQKPFSLH